MFKKLLMTPGPTPIPESVLLNMAKPIIHHRTDEFKTLMNSAKTRLQKLFQTTNEIVIFSSSGTGAMEAAVVNLVSPGEKTAVVSAGKFGERWVQLNSTFGARPVVIKKDYGDFVTPEEIDAVLKKHPNISCLFMQACETSTGVFHPIDEIGLLLKNKFPEVVFVVDGITAIGAIDVKTDLWGIDIMITGSQKALMLPPGLGIISISEKAKNKMLKNSTPRYYFDIKKEIEAGYGNFTPPVTLIVALNESLKIILDKVTLKGTFERHRLLAKATREAIMAMNLRLFAKRPSDSLTAVISPEGVNSGKIIEKMKNMGVEIANGQGPLKDKIFRIAHMGYFDKQDILTCITSLEMSLKKLRIEHPFGEGVIRAMEVLSE